MLHYTRELNPQSIACKNGLEAPNLYANKNRLHGCLSESSQCAMAGTSEKAPSAWRPDSQCNACCNTRRHELFSLKASMLKIPHTGRGPSRTAGFERRTRGNGEIGRHARRSGRRPDVGRRDWSAACSRTSIVTPYRALWALDNVQNGFLVRAAYWANNRI